MGLILDPQSAAARDLAKRAVPEGGTLDIVLLLAALYHTSGLLRELPQLTEVLPKPPQLHETTPEKVPLSEDLRRVLTELAANVREPLTPRRWFSELLASEQGQLTLLGSGLPKSQLDSVLSTLGLRTGGGAATVNDGSPPDFSNDSWRSSPERTEAISALQQFGRMLTQDTSAPRHFVQQDSSLRSLIRALLKRKSRSALVIGPPGTGKTAVVHELARRLATDDESLPERLRGMDIFELSPGFLRAGASMVGEYDARVKTLLETMKKYPRIILFVDEVHSLLQSGMHERGPYTDANEGFKQALNSGEVTLIGCTTTAEYRHYIEADQALAQRFSLVRIDPPSPQATLQILIARLPSITDFYGLEIAPELLQRVVDLTEEYLPSRAQPRKSIQLLDEACAFCTADPQRGRVLEEADLWNGLEETIGHALVQQDDMTADQLYRRLSSKIIGQDAALKAIAQSVMGSLGSLASGRSRPRGVFLFGGPSGVGKTETALQLAEVLGGGREALIRIDCNMLQGTAQDNTAALNVLLGAPPGYIGYVRGKGGELSKIRDQPQSVVLFDEIEKASFSISDLLLQIMDDGRCEDVEGNVLDFRRAFIIFTTNAGSLEQPRPSIGFSSSGTSRSIEAAGTAHDVENLQNALRALGFHDAFLGRIDHCFFFSMLGTEAIRRILTRALDRLAKRVEDTARSLRYDAPVVETLASHWQPHFGARQLFALVDVISREIIAAESEGQLEGIHTLLVERDPTLCDTPDAQAPPPQSAGSLTISRQLRGSSLAFLVK